MRKIRLREESLRKLIKEMGGVYPDGQVDMFFDQDGVDEYRSSANGRAIEALLRAEKECGWEHSATKDMGKYVEYVCYPSSDYMSKDRKTFIDTIMRYAPIKDNINIVCQRNSYTKVINVRIKNI
jgi:hypothetical protein